MNAPSPPENILICARPQHRNTACCTISARAIPPSVLEPSHSTSDEQCVRAAPHFRCSCSGCRVRKLFVAQSASIADSLAVSLLLGQGRELWYTYLVPHIDDIGTVMPARCTSTVIDQSACCSLDNSVYSAVILSKIWCVWVAVDMHR